MNTSTISRVLAGMLVLSACAFSPIEALAMGFTSPISYGTLHSAEVSQMQQILIAQGFLKLPAPTGNYLSLTKVAVTAFQKAHGIIATGNFGPLTLAAMNIEASILNLPISKIKSITLTQKAQSTHNQSASVIEAFTDDSLTITWESNGYPATSTVNINLIQKVSDSPVAYSLVANIASNVPNIGSYVWKPLREQTGADLYVEVTCSKNSISMGPCQISTDPAPTVFAH